MANEFQQYRATTKVHLGAIQQDIMEETIVEYDGSTLKLGGQSYNVPSVAGAIKLGWLVPIADNISRYIPKPAGVQVRPATSASQERGQPMTIEPAEDDELEVGSLSGSNAKRAEALANQNPASQQRPQATGLSNQQQIADLQRQIAMLQRNDRTADPVAKSAKYTVTHEDPPVEIDFPGVGKAKTPTTLSAKDIAVDDPHNAGSRPVARLSPAVKKTVLTSSLDADREIRSLDPVTGERSKVQKVSSVSRTNRDAEGGVSINQTHRTGATGDVAETMTGDDLSDILPEAATSGKPRAGIVQQGVDGDTRLAWDKSLQWRARVKKAVDLYGNDRNAIRQILEVEDPTVARHIREALAPKK